jgi:hypothetical protein
MRIYCQLKGSTFCNGQKILRSIVSNGRELLPTDLLLVRDHECDKDPNCVQVRYHNDDMDEKIGNVNIESSTAEIISLNLCGTVDTNIGMYFTVNTGNQR